MKAKAEHEKQRAFRKKHAPEKPPFVGVWLREGDAHCLAAGIITDSLRQLAVEALAEFWPEEHIDGDQLQREGTAIPPLSA